MFKIVLTKQTDYDHSADKEELEALVAELNQDAIDAEDSDRWSVVVVQQ